MFSQLNGIIIDVAADHAVIDVRGVGYQVFCPGRSLGSITVGQETRLYTVLNVREDALTLFGFTDRTERQIFLLLTQHVSGVGPRIGLALLSAFSAMDIASYIVGNQPSMLARANGVGKKLAEKIIVELKDKLKNEPIIPLAVASRSSLSDAHRDVVSALVNLGYHLKLAETAVAGAIKDAPDASFENLFKIALGKI